jgi:pyruvate/2-oxoglutarate dehydrogenase complex dihydrolipoamide acyltransferase (E2) component
MDFRKQNLDAFVKRYGVKLGFMSAFCKATAYALQDQPVVNAVIEDNVNLKTIINTLKLKVFVYLSRKPYIVIMWIFLWPSHRLKV